MSGWVVQILRQVDETRWFWRVVLRRRYRYLVEFSGVPEKMALTRALNAPTGAEVTLRIPDPLAVLQTDPRLS